MSRRLSKKELKVKKIKNRDAKIKRMEYQDKLGISRKHVKGTMRPELFITLKIISIVSIPVVYIIYSPLLIVCIIFSIVLYVYASMTERYINKTYIKKNHVKILKIDSVIAVILLIITIFGTLNGMNGKVRVARMNMSSMYWMRFENFGSCLTGTRSIFRDVKMMMFSISGKMPDFQGGQMIRGGNFQGRVKIASGLQDLPLEMIFSTIISSINTVLLVLLPLTSLLSLWLFKNRHRRFEKYMNEAISDNFEPMSDEEITRLLMFGLEPIEEANET